MKNISSILITLVLAVPLLIVGCSQKEINSITSQTNEITSQATEGLKSLGSKAYEVADKAVNEVKGFINKENSGGNFNTKELEKNWNMLKEKFIEMANSAKSQEVKNKINESLANLEKQFNTLIKDLESNKDVSNAKNAITKFWKSAIEKLNELMK